MAKYNSQKIKLSKEHRAYIFVEKDMLNEDDDYQKIALKALEIQNGQN